MRGSTKHFLHSRLGSDKVFVGSCAQVCVYVGLYMNLLVLLLGFWLFNAFLPTHNTQRSACISLEAFAFSWYVSLPPSMRCVQV